MIRAAKINDLSQIERVYAAARSFMAQNGNPTQWGGSYPEREIILADISQNQLYVLENEGAICGAFAFMAGPDPTYMNIYSGAWQSETPYFCIHRVASDGSVKGFLSKIFAFCRESSDHIRIDTHEDNKVMQHVLHKCGFVRCGTVYLENGDPRIAYEFIA